MLDALVHCQPEAHLNAIMLLVFIVGYILVKLFIKSTEPTNEVRERLQVKANEVEEYMRYYQKEDEDFFIGGLPNIQANHE
jgi:uncharacterized membrane protein affecting hemolysin expression